MLEKNDTIIHMIKQVPPNIYMLITVFSLGMAHFENAKLFAVNKACNLNKNNEKSLNLKKALFKLKIN